MEKNIKEVLAVLGKELIESKAKDVVVLDMSNQETLFDYFVIATFESNTHLDGLIRVAKNTLETSGHELSHTEGRGGNKWVALDFGGIVVHLQDGESRLFYNLERIWGEAEKLAM